MTMQRLGSLGKGARPFARVGRRSGLARVGPRQLGAAPARAMEEADSLGGAPLPAPKPVATSMIPRPAHAIVPDDKQWESLSPAETLDVELPNFDTVHKAFEHLPTSALVRAYFVLQACRLDFIVTHAEKLLGLSQAVLGKSITHSIVRNTFFKHFCGAESEDALQPVMRRLEGAGVSAILDYAAESDLDVSRDPREEEVSARTYEYEGERACDAAADVFLKCITTAHNVAQLSTTGSRPFAAIKVTALGNPKLLKNMSKMIIEARQLFQRMEDELKRPSVGALTLEEWRIAFNKYFMSSSPEDVDDLFWYAIGLSKEEWEATRGDEVPKLDIVDWGRSMNISIISKLIADCRLPGPLAQSALSEEELELARALFGRLNRLAARASELDVSLMIDAEQTYFQPCIDANVLMLQRRYNTDKATIFGTYQCYLKSTDWRLAQDVERAKREGWVFACKLVRGAYMVSERRLAEENGYESPIFDTIEDTHDCYNRSLETLIAHPSAEVMIASHNQKSCEFACEKMNEYKIKPEDGRVHFGQLYGMSDHITYTLGRCGYSAYKYLPYGKVEEVLPYLIRRAQENSGLMAGAVFEKQIIASEIRRRLFG